MDQQLSMLYTKSQSNDDITADAVRKLETYGADSSAYFAVRYASVYE